VSVVFFGSSEFAVQPLERIAGEVQLVVTQPPKPSGRGRRLTRTPVHERAEALGLEVEAPSRCRDPEFVARISALKPLALVVASYGQILPKALLEAAVRGGINLHASLLPKYRGAAPIQWAILSGETKTGVTLMQMDEGCDTGPIIACRETAIGPDETAGELEARLSHLAADLLTDTWPSIQDGSYQSLPQDPSRATQAPKLSVEDGWLRFEETSETAYRRFRACTPRPGCHVTLGGERVLVTSARLGQNVACEPGAFIGFEGDAMLLSFAGGSALAIATVRPPGRKEMSGRAFVAGRRWAPGDRVV
jgi:methionyl-tRNA formyltransferase